MLSRLLKLPGNRSYFLFGARNTGKSTLIKHIHQHVPHMLFDLLDPELETRFTHHPNDFRAMVEAAPTKVEHVIIDEIQKVPPLLDIVHYLIEKTNKKFIMTGSSARKLKHGGANLLAGRAFVYHLHPFSFVELSDQFKIEQALSWGLLPDIYSMSDDEARMKFLQAYAHTYLKEEIWVEQFIRDLDPFRRFLEVAAQMNGKIINFAKIARDIHVEDKTIKKYYSILEDTMIGFFLDGFQHSFRKRLSTKPKFYFFDTGVVRALSRTLSVPLMPSTSAYGEAFEHLVILEAIKLASYFKTEYQFSYVQTSSGAEIDLLVERPGQKTLMIEIKSAQQVHAQSLRTLMEFANDFGDCEAICLANEPYPRRIEQVRVMPWQQGLKEYFS